MISSFSFGYNFINFNYNSKIFKLVFTTLLNKSYFKLANKINSLAHYAKGTLIKT